MIMTFEEVEPKRKKISQPLPSFSSLPDEITENILARVSRWNYPSLSLVSKSFHSILSSMEIYKTRSQIGTEETCVYVCLRLHNQPYPSWFMIWAKPNNQTLTKQRGKIRFKKDPAGNSVIPIPIHSPQITSQSTTVGHEIYIIGGPCDEPSSSVWILDCRSHTWRNGPNMTVAREDPCVFSNDDKIYVMGGCNIDECSSRWFEVFDMETQSWTVLPGPGADNDELRILLAENNYDLVNVIDEKFFVMINGREYTYEPTKDGTWKLLKGQSDSIDHYNEVVASSWINDVIYCCTCDGDLIWCDPEDEGREWREVKGLQRLRDDCTMGLRSASKYAVEDYGGKLMVMWGYSDDIQRENKIWYAKISLERSSNGREIWGKIECVDELTFPCESYEFFDCFCILA
ncbi:unnamed protein product [Eruca vesicaria subsp. sativa]|uniref:F-box domain-containing protein n=1 Tax=Eruca vesicaria subsp. sativa TaxID=29727 RepID=A0ABC8KAG7_ERUVS|nr:unnamed protein product [Eruca vesicaria subsp. sativa]